MIRPILFRPRVERTSSTSRNKVGVRDQREIELRKDVLVYTSAPLEREHQIVGNVRVHLQAATSGKDTDFTAKLVVVRPDGYARIVEEGIARVGRMLATLPAPGQPFEIDIDLGHTAIAVPVGHRLRLEVSSSNFPKYDRNPNTGEDAYVAARLAVAKQTVFHGESKLSWLELPLRGKPLVASAAGRQPLVTPVVTEIAVAPVAGSDAAELLAEGRRQLEAGETEEAIATLERGVELEAGVSAYHFWLGRAYLDRLQAVSMFKKLGLSKKVVASYKRAIELDAEQDQARQALKMLAKAR